MRNVGLIPRTLGASAVVAALVCASLAVLLLSVSASRSSLVRQSHSKDVAVAAVTLERVVSDLEAGLRGYMITRDDAFLGSWRRARNQLPRAQERLQRLVVADPVERRAVAALADEISTYLDFSLAVLRLAQFDPQVAASPAAQTEDRRETDQIRSGLQQLVAHEDARAAARARSVHRESSRAVATALAALLASGALILLFGAYLATAVARPVRRAAAAAGHVAAGDFSGRLPEAGPGEVGDLARAFNAMARSLEESRRELLQQNELLAEAERHKSELISIVSHEVRTPLSSLLGFTDLLLRRDLDERTRRRYVEIVHGESRRLAALTRDFLDVRLLEEGRLELALERIDLAEIAREQAQVFLSQSPEHPLVLDLPDEPLWVEGDRDRLSQVVGNLVANAIKYSPEGGEVEVRAACEEGRARVEVADHGLGIPLDDQPLIFTKFYRGRAAASGIPGTGLGLAIARELVHAHGGEIDFESELGRGTTFRVELPTAA